MKHITLLILIGLSTLFISKAQFDDRFYYPSKEWNEIENLDFNDYYFTIEDDTLHSILFNSENTPKATILFFHGAGGNISTYLFMIEPLVSANYQVFTVDFRGYGKSTGKPTHLNIASDAQIIINDLVTKDEIKNLPIIIYGASMGTQIATKLTKNNQEKISGLVLDGTISSFTDMALLNTPDEQKAVVSQYVTSPYSAKQDIKDIASIPKLFIHSKNDKSVPFAQGQLVFNNAQEPKTFWEYEGNHIDAVSNATNEFIEKINNLIK